VGFQKWEDKAVATHFGGPQAVLSLPCPVGKEVKVEEKAEIEKRKMADGRWQIERSSKQATGRAAFDHWPQTGKLQHICNCRWDTEKDEKDEKEAKLGKDQGKRASGGGQLPK